MAQAKLPTDVPKAAEFGLLRAYLAQNQMSQAQIKAAIGQRPNGRTRAEIAAELRAWLAEL